MPPASRKTCDYPFCDKGPPDDRIGSPTPYITPDGLTTRQEVNEDLKFHVDTAHMMVIRFNEWEAKRIDAEARKNEAKTSRNLSTREPLPPSVQDELVQQPHHQPRPVTDK